MRLARLKRDLRGMWITEIESIGQYHHHVRLCVLDYNHLKKHEVSPAYVAATIIHEATHARLMLAGFGYEAERRARVEEICFRAEIAFASRLPDGHAIIEEARAQLQRDPQVWTNEAARARRTSKLRELGFPEWLIRLANRGL